MSELEPFDNEPRVVEEYMTEKAELYDGVSMEDSEEAYDRLTDILNYKPTVSQARDTLERISEGLNPYVAASFPALEEVIERPSIAALEPQKEQ